MESLNLKLERKDYELRSMIAHWLEVHKGDEHVDEFFHTFLEKTMLKNRASSREQSFVDKIKTGVLEKAIVDTRDGDMVEFLKSELAQIRKPEEEIVRV